MNPVDLEQKITDKTKVVILQHTYGLTPIQRAKIQAIVRSHKLLLIEDIAHGYSNQLLENITETSIFLFSFGRSKVLSSVFGSAIMTNSSIISDNLKRLDHKLYSSNWFIFRLLLYKPLTMIIKSTYDSGLGKLLHRIINLTKILVPEISTIEKNGTFDMTLNKAYPNALAILLHHQLKKFEQVREHRASICDIYSKNLKNQSLIIKNSSLIRYPVIVNQPQKILDKASEQNIFLGKWYDQVVAPKSVSLENVKYKLGSCPIAEKLCQHIINLPTTIGIKDAYKIIKIIQ
jgi:dTDP-4-amino-4,6-dideoxygalactose transaminase